MPEPPITAIFVEVMGCPFVEPDPKVARRGAECNHTFAWD
ncbi:hypothetical protein Z948_2607 [Sulfitobacter donghicola DSW-25 = KCTC 12864 = JCM 14565]|nr:hypothetical protein Z948_2607 [Sulfitobacter donghicola DSW-25 = KCTC 12864 = JCM 14565]